MCIKWSILKYNKTNSTPPVIRLAGEEALLNLKEAIKFIDSAIFSNMVIISLSKHDSGQLMSAIDKDIQKASKSLKLAQSELKVFEKELNKHYQEIDFSTAHLVHACDLFFSDMGPLRLKETKSEIENTIFEIERTLDNLNEN